MGKHDWAIVVGIDTYFDSTLPPLKGPENDARAFHQWVISSDGGNVPEEQAFCILSSAFPRPFASAADARPTVNEIVARFDEIRARAAANAEKGGGYRAGDRVYLFFAGHGFAPSHRQDQTALLVADADTATSQLTHVLGTYMADTLYHLKLFDEVFLFMDCCRSSSECAQLYMPYGDDTAPDYWKVRRFYAYGARAGQEARERDFGDGRIHGVFTRTLLDGLRGAAYDPDDPKKITAESLQNLLYNAYPEHMDPELRADPSLPNEPEVVFERKPDQKLVVGPAPGMLGRLMSSKPTFAVRIRAGVHAGKNALITGKSLQVVQRLRLADENALELERGIYALFVDGAATRKFEVTGASGTVEVELEERKTVRLEVVAADAATELYVIDGDYNLLDRGIGAKVFDVTPGLYKIKARAGMQQEERLVIVHDDEKVEIAPLEFLSPVPLANTAGTTQEQIAAAEHVTTHVDARFGAGSSIAILMMGTKNKTRLRRMDGSELAEVPEAFHAVVDPGGYRLALELADGRLIEQTLVAAPGWQTRVFIPEDVAHTAVSMRREGTPFDSNDADARLEEIARQALIHGRKVLSDELRARIAAPDVAPMLGIMGMHLLIHEAKRNKQSREENRDQQIDVVDNVEDVSAVIGHLRAAIGKHPDVEAIAIGAGVADPEYAFDVPPMLTLSWRLLLKATSTRPELIPRGSFGEQIAMRLWGENVWLQWIDPATDRVDREAAWQENALRMMSVRELVTGAPQEERPFEVTGWLKGLMKSEALPAVPSVRLVLRTDIDAERKRKLVKHLGVPMAALESWLASLEKSE